MTDLSRRFNVSVALPKGSPGMINGIAPVEVASWMLEVVLNSPRLVCESVALRIRLLILRG